MKAITFLLLLSTSLSSQVDFPNKWLGTWTGTLNVFPAKPNSQTVEVTLEIKSTDTAGTYSWFTQYKTPERRLNKAYLLRVKDASRGLFEIDEQDGIVLSATLFDNELWSFFSVQGSMLVSVYRFFPEYIEFEIPSALQADETQTGNVVHNNDSIPAVASYPVRSLQKTTLRRLKP